MNLKRHCCLFFILSIFKNITISIRKITINHKKVTTTNKNIVAYFTFLINP